MNTLIKDWQNIEKWKKLCPELQISSDFKEKESNTSSSNNTASVLKSKRDENDATLGLIRDGYALVGSKAMASYCGEDKDFNSLEEQHQILQEKLKIGIEQLTDAGLPASFILVFDETWKLARDASKFLTGITHKENILNFDLLAWHIDSSKGDVGVSA